VPSVRPFFASGAETALGLAWKAGVAAEVLCRPYGTIGASLYNAKIYFETADVFAWTAVIVILSMVLELALIRAMKLLFGRRRNAA